MTLRIRTTPEADEHAELADAWWRANRPAAKALVAQELADAVRLVADAPGAGALDAAAPFPGIRRVRLPKTRYDLYYFVDEDVIVILAVWSFLRGRPPPIRVL